MAEAFPCSRGADALGNSSTEVFFSGIALRILVCHCHEEVMVEEESLPVIDKKGKLAVHAPFLLLLKRFVPKEIPLFV